MISHAQGLAELDQELAAEECVEKFSIRVDTGRYSGVHMGRLCVLFQSPMYRRMDTKTLKAVS